MDQIGVVGLSYRHAGADDIAGFTLPKDDLAERLVALRAALGTAELVYLATCNRVEVVFAMPDEHSARDLRAEVFRALTGRTPGPGEARTALRTWIGEAAVEHLFLTACGLDSAQAGEREIAAQLRGALEVARTAGVCGPVLDRIVGEALSLSGRLQKMAADARPPSLADLAADRMLGHLGGNTGAVAGAKNGATASTGSSPALLASGGIIAILGVSPMTRRASELLHKAGAKLIVVNRSREAAEELARSVNGEAIALDAFRAQPRDVAGLIVATGGTEPVLDAAAVQRLAKVATRSLLIIDFGLPPNIDPQAAKDAGLRRIGMDEMIQAAQDRRLAQLLRLAPMRAAIDERLTRIREQLASRAIGPQLAQLRSSFERIASAEVDRALAEELHELDPRQQEQLRRVISTLAHRLAHLPLAGMRAAAPHANPETVEAFFREARLQRVAPAAIANDSASAPPAHSKLSTAAIAANASASASLPSAASTPVTPHAAVSGAAPLPIQPPAMAHTSESRKKRSR
jgi:glutamyl-tRNA reductase